ncbi:hypothetical protein K6U56_12050, partial [Vibrio furnissii]|nr:hypothetical protein [Vibrio furnissii]
PPPPPRAACPSAITQRPRHHQPCWLIFAGQAVDVRLDMYPDTVIAGLIDSITPATGAQFSMIPPQNATGNFVKVVQRVPVKITLTLPDSLKGRVYPGLSAVVSIALQP